MSATINVTVKTLKKEEFVFQVRPEDTVLSLKEQIEKRLGYEVAAQKLIFTGKILVDSQTVASANIQEGNFLVLLPSARKGAAPASTPASTTTPSSTPSTTAPPSPSPTPSTTTTTTPSTTPPSTTTTTTTTPSTTPTTTTTTPSATDLENDLATGSDYETKLNELVEMGYERSKAVIAMEAAFNNVLRAADYLINGIPASVQQGARIPRTPSSPTPTTPSTPTPTTPSTPSTPSTTTTTTPTPTTPTTPTTTTPTSGGGDSLWDAATHASETAAPGGGSGALDFLRNLPYFNQLRLAVQSNPNMLPLILQQLAQTQPQVLQLIQAHQQEFIELLSEPVAPGAIPGLPGAPGGPQIVQIQLTPAEHQSVQNLINLGFDRNRVLQAFIACDKNENDAANFLFENAADDDDDGGAGGAGLGDSQGLEDDEDDYF